MKRLLIICLLLVLPLSARAELGADTRGAMLAHTDALAALMGHCAASDAYRKLYSTNSELDSMFLEITQVNWEAPTGGTAYVLKPGAIETFLSASGLSLADFPQDVADKVRQSVVGSIPSAVVSQYSAMHAAMSAILRTGDMFVADDAFPDYALVFMHYNGAYAAVCAFVKNADGIVSASLIPVPDGCEDRLKAVMGVRTLFGSTDRMYEAYALER